MNFGEAIPIPLDTADGSKVGRDDLTPPPCKTGLNCCDKLLGLYTQDVIVYVMYEKPRNSNSINPLVHHHYCRGSV